MLWVKAFHVVFVVAWFSGTFYLPRLFVNHAMLGPQETAVAARLALMERKLFRFTTMNMVLAMGLGAWLLAGYAWEAYGRSPWLHGKLALVLVLVGYHVVCGRLVGTFARGENVRTDRFYRLFNELPVLLLMAIVVLVVVKPGH
jgi:protoporphyrinogen IX oxidase